jgi:chaperonin GroEL
MNFKEAIRVTETVYGDESQAGLLAGVKTLHDPVASTLGASGRTVIIEDKHGYPQPTKDGVTVAKNIVPLDSVERMGCEIIKQASKNTAEEAGDGTTTSTILASAVIISGLEKMKDKSVNYTDFNRGMKEAVDFLSKKLDEASYPVTLDNIESVATISANNDEQLGSVIASAFKKAGEHGVVLMEKSETSETYVSLTEGFELEKGYSSDVFVTDKETNRAEYRDALVLISNVKIERLAQVEPFAEYAITHGHRGLVIVSEVEDAVLAALAMNKVKGNIKCVVVAPSHFGIRRKDILSDLAVSTGGRMIDEETGDNFDEFSIPQDATQRADAFERIATVLGSVRKVTIDRNKSVFFNDISDDCQEHIEILKKQLSKEKNPLEKKFYEERISKISSAVAVVNVGASSETEQSEKADRVDDAIHAVRAALQEGIVAGGGVALHNAASIGSTTYYNANKAVNEGFHCVMDACTTPLQICLSNGDIEYHVEDFSVPNEGINVKNGQKGDMIEMNIIDPVKVTKTALKNGVSAASTLLSTTTTIVNLRRA